MFIEDVEVKRKVRRFRARCLICNTDLTLAIDSDDDPWEWAKSDSVANFLIHHRQICGAGNERVAGIEVDEVEVDF